MKYLESESVQAHEQLSALHDGELSSADAAALVRASLADESLMLQWRSMSAISHALREQQSITLAQPVMKAHDVGSHPESVALPQAANDGIFRWKMVAGLAVFAAVGSLAWGLLGNVGEKAGVQGGVLAQSQIQSPNVPAVNASGQALISVGGQVAGQEATMLRDPRLDELLAAHKQFGGISALQQPAGSLRSVSLGGARP